MQSQRNSCGRFTTSIVGIVAASIEQLLVTLQETNAHYGSWHDLQINAGCASSDVYVVDVPASAIRRAFNQLRPTDRVAV